MEESQHFTSSRVTSEANLLTKQQLDNMANKYMNASKRLISNLRQSQELFLQNKQKAQHMQSSNKNKSLLKSSRYKSATASQKLIKSKHLIANSDQDFHSPVYMSANKIYYQNQNNNLLSSSKFQKNQNNPTPVIKLISNKTHTMKADDKKNVDKNWPDMKNNDFYQMGRKRSQRMEECSTRLKEEAIKIYEKVEKYKQKNNQELALKQSLQSKQTKNQQISINYQHLNDKNANNFQKNNANINYFNKNFNQKNLLNEYEPISQQKSLSQTPKKTPSHYSSEFKDPQINLYSFNHSKIPSSKKMLDLESQFDVNSNKEFKENQIAKKQTDKVNKGLSIISLQQKVMEKDNQNFQVVNEKDKNENIFDFQNERQRALKIQNTDYNKGLLQMHSQIKQNTRDYYRNINYQKQKNEIVQNLQLMSLTSKNNQESQLKTLSNFQQKIINEEKQKQKYIPSNNTELFNSFRAYLHDNEQKFNQNVNVLNPYENYKTPKVQQPVIRNRLKSNDFQDQRQIYPNNQNAHLIATQLENAKRSVSNYRKTFYSTGEHLQSSTSREHYIQNQYKKLIQQMNQQKKIQRSTNKYQQYKAYQKETNPYEIQKANRNQYALRKSSLQYQREFQDNNRLQPKQYKNNYYLFESKKSKKQYGKNVEQSRHQKNQVYKNHNVQIRSFSTKKDIQTFEKPNYKNENQLIKKDLSNYNESHLHSKSSKLKKLPLKQQRINLQHSKQSKNNRRSFQQDKQYQYSFQQLKDSRQLIKQSKDYFYQKKQSQPYDKKPRQQSKQSPISRFQSQNNINIYNPKPTSQGQFCLADYIEAQKKQASQRSRLYKSYGMVVVWKERQGQSQSISTIVAAVEHYIYLTRCLLSVEDCSPFKQFQQLRRNLIKSLKGQCNCLSLLKVQDESLLEFKNTPFCKMAKKHLFEGYKRCEMLPQSKLEWEVFVRNEVQRLITLKDQSNQYSNQKSQSTSKTSKINYYSPQNANGQFNGQNPFVRRQIQCNRKIYMLIQVFFLLRYLKGKGIKQYEGDANVSKSKYLFNKYMCSWLPTFRKNCKSK